MNGRVCLIGMPNRALERAGVAGVMVIRAPDQHLETTLLLDRTALIKIRGQIDAVLKHCSQKSFDDLDDGDPVWDAGRCGEQPDRPLGRLILIREHGEVFSVKVRDWDGTEYLYSIEEARKRLKHYVAVV